ncbi:MAG TPA: efflux RND transporter periplasmic adaptor subunit [Kiritimatiellia bacterium]|nr:efflux RND transporter periplasmic adaptor subunit [Kiritimatiellia bacterium]
MNIAQLTASLRTVRKPIIGALALLAIVLWTTGAFREKTPPGRVENLPGFPLPDAAATLTLQTASLPGTIEVLGTTSSEETVELRARIGGFVHELHAAAGDRVESGQILLRIDDREARAERLAAHAALQQAESEYQRTLRLRETNAATEQQLTAAQAAFRSAAARLEQADVALSFTEIKSPIRGIVIDRQVETGDLAQPGHLLFTVYNPDTMRLEAHVPVRLIDRIRLGAPADIHLERPDRMFTGTVTEIVAAIDPRSRTQLIRIRIDHTDADLLPGTFGRLWIRTEPRPGISLPASALFRMGQLEMVQIVRDDRVLRRLVRSLPLHGDSDHLEISSGLLAGDTVLLTPILER